ncbi:MAG: hypothetical protein M3137_11880 [Actinomycetota bacterium]|nr:hypothetical protein [Actinomycetota bacterium]
MPPELEGERSRSVAIADQLLRGKVVHGRWTEGNITTDPDFVANMERAEHGVRLELLADHELTLGNTLIDIGSVEHRYMQVVADGFDPVTGDLHVRAGKNDRFELRLTAVPERTNLNGTTSWIPPAMVEPYAGQWVAQSGTKLLQAGASFQAVTAAVKATGQLATVWRVPSSDQEGEALPAVGL